MSIFKYHREALIYLKNGTKPNTAFVVNVLTWFNSTLTKRHWNGVKKIFRYLRGTKNLDLFITENQGLSMVLYVECSLMDAFTPIRPFGAILVISENKGLLP